MAKYKAKVRSSQINEWDVDDIQHFVKKQQGLMWHTELRDRIEDEFVKFYCLDQEPVSKSKGEYDWIVDNAPRVFADKLIEELSSAKLRYTIPIVEQTKTEQNRGSMTEQAVYGLRNMSDDRLTAVPYGCPSQAQEAFYTITTGFIIGRFWMYIEKQHGEEVLVPDLALWHFSNTFWEVKRDGLKRIAHVRYATASELNDAYGKDYEDVADKGIEIVEYWDEEWCKITCRGEVMDKFRHGLGYVPARVITSGSMPIVQVPDPVNNYGTTLAKYLAPSCWAKNTAMYLASSELLTYYKTLVGKQVERPKKSIYDSTMGGKPIQLNSNPDQKSATVEVDAGKGQDIQEMYVPEMTRDAQELFGVFQQRIEQGSAPPIIHGVVNQAMTAQGTSMLIHAALGSMNQGKRAIEAFETWKANEMIRQYKDGDWDDITVQGTDGKDHQFAMTIKRDQLVTDRRIEAALNIETPQDELENIGKAAELKKSQLASDKYIKDRILKMADPEADSIQMTVERVKSNLGLELRAAQRQFIEDKDMEAAAWLEMNIKALTQELMARLMPPPQAPGQPPGAGMGAGAPPSAMPGQAMGNAMPSQAMRRGMQVGTP